MNIMPMTMIKTDLLVPIICLNYIHRSDDSLSRLTVVSREAKKKQHACASSGLRDHYSELFTLMAALKF